MSQVNKSILKKKCLKTSRKSVDQVLKITPETERVDIPTLHKDVVEDVDVEFDTDIEEELLSYGYIPISNINIKDEDGNITNQYTKVINPLGQKVYVKIDTDNVQNLDSDLTLVETKNGNILPYSLKNGSLKMAGFDTAGLIIESCEGICALSNVMNEADENLTSVESNFTFVEQNNPSSTVIENYGCHMSYPVVKLSEIRVNNALVIDGANVVTKKLRNSSYNAYLQDMKNVQHSICELSVQNNALITLLEVNATKLNETLTTLEGWNKYYLDNPPVTDCDIKKHNLIIHNMRIRNDYVAYLICGMKRVAEYQPQIDKITNDIVNFNEFFNNQFSNLDMATNI